MKKTTYNNGVLKQDNDLEKHIKAIDNLIQSGRLVIDMLRGTAAIDSYLWLYYNQKEELTQGFCLMIREWINFQRSWKKGELLGMVESGRYSYIRENELFETIEEKKYPNEMKSSVCPTRLQAEKISLGSDEQKKRYLEEYINSRYCLWPDAAPILLVCIGVDGKAIASIEQTQQPLRLIYKKHE